MTREPIVQTLQLTKRYGDKVALDSLDLTVLAGEIYGFLGPNGAGKTTTIRLLLGLVSGTSGEVRIFGSPVRPGRADLRRVGAMVEQPGLYPHLTGAENLRAFAYMRGGRLSDDDVRVSLRSAGLGSDDRAKVRQYSAGMRQRLALALALGGTPSLLILDEPTDGLDPIGIVDIRATITSLAGRGTTVFLSSHLLSEVEKLCTRIGILVEGRLVREGSLADIGRDAAQIVLEFVGAEVTDRALRHLADLGFEAARGSSLLEAVLPENGTNVGAVTRALAGVGIEPRQVSVRQVSLENLFVGLARQPGGRP